MTKIVQLVNTCRECPNRHYYSGGAYECMKVQPSMLNEDMSIPAWCPLADYRALASTPLPAQPSANFEGAYVYSLIVAMFKQPDEALRSMQAQDLARELRLGTWAPTKGERDEQLAAAREMMERDRANGFLPSAKGQDGIVLHIDTDADLSADDLAAVERLELELGGSVVVTRVQLGTLGGKIRLAARPAGVKTVDEREGNKP